MGAFNGAAYGAAKGYTDEKLGKGPQSLGSVTNGGSLPVSRKDGTPIQEGDYLLPLPSSNFSFDITYSGGTLHFENKKSVATFVGNNKWHIETSSMQRTDETPTANKTLESFHGTADTQSEINKENKVEFGKRELLENKVGDLDDVEDGDLTSYPNAYAVKKGLKKKLDENRMIGGIKLDKDITVQELIDIFKDVARTYKNVTINCDYNTISEIVTSMFKAGQILSSIPDKITVEEYKLATIKAVRDAITKALKGAVILQGSKNTKAEIEALTDMSVGDEWFCKEDSHFWTYSEQDGWIDSGGNVDLSNYLQKSDIVNNLTTNDSEKLLSAAMGKKLKEMVDGKQDAIDLTDYSNAIATLNPNHLFNIRQFKTLLGIKYATIEGELPQPITNITNESKEVLKLPPLAAGYSYPNKVRIDITEPSGPWTCEENRVEFYDTSGEHYVDPSIAFNRQFTFQSIERVEGAYDRDGNEILIAEQLKNRNNCYIVNEDGSPAVTKEILEYIIGTGFVDATKQVYTLKNTPGQGYTYVDKYYDSNGEEHVGNYYALQLVNIQVDTEYMHKCYLMNYMLNVLGRNFLVDSEGRLCKFEIQEAQDSKLIKAKEQTLNSYFEGINGIVVITPINHAALYQQVNAYLIPHTTIDDTSGDEVIDYYSLAINGTNCLSDFVINKL